jgi:hypothetical protein
MRIRHLERSDTARAVCLQLVLTALSTYDPPILVLLRARVGSRLAQLKCTAFVSNTVLCVYPCRVDRVRCSAVTEA